MEAGLARNSDHADAQCRSLSDTHFVQCRQDLHLAISACARGGLEILFDRSRASLTATRLTPRYEPSASEAPIWPTGCFCAKCGTPLGYVYVDRSAPFRNR